MNCGETRIVSYDELTTLVKEVFEVLRVRKAEGATVLALHGDLGAGKTTFTKFLGQQLGVSEHMVSPTFTIMKGYETTDETFAHLIHMDAYRIDVMDELGPLRFTELLAMPHTLCIIEWAERVQSALPKDTTHLSLAVVDEHTRTAHLSCL